MKKFLLLGVSFLPFLGFSQWTKISHATKSAKEEFSNLQERQLFQLDKNKFKAELSNAPERFSGEKGVEVLMPNEKGELQKFLVWEYSSFTPELQAKYPGIRSYVGVGVTDPTAYLRFSISDLGLSSSVLKSGGSHYVEPYSDQGDVYAAYESGSKLKSKEDEFLCSTIDEIAAVNTNSQVTTKSSNQVLKTFRLAISAEGGYSQYHINRAGGASLTDDEKKAIVVAALNNSVTRINALYEKDLAVHFNLVNNTEIIYLDPDKDPYTSGSYNSQVRTVMANVVKSANYDVGHVVAYDGPNGNAGCIGCVCVSSTKGGGFTSHYIPVGDIFDIDYLAHEIGHQMGANHTHTYQSSTEGYGVQVEPGSGNTIMAYTGITASYDTQFNSNDFFTYRSILQIQNNLATKSCAVNTPLINTPPVVDAGADYAIPSNTPFVLRGNVTDAENDPMTYVWEQNDPATLSMHYGNGSFASPTKTDGPTFKMFPPTSEPVRYFPEYTKILAGVNATRWEALSTIDRTLNFTLTARDNSANGSQTNTDAMKITVSAAAGPFVVTAPAFGESLVSSKPYTVKWNVANTTAAPINTTLVNIKFSTDGGQTFTTLASNVNNDGEETVTIPANSTTPEAFFIVEAVNNVYFAVSPSFVVDYSVSGETCNTYQYTGSAVDINDAVGGSVSSPQVEAPIQVTGSGVITSVKVTPNIQHANMIHLAIGLEGPTGASALFFNRTCSSRANLTASFSEAGSNLNCAGLASGNYKPNESLAIFKGNQAQGEWKIFASDNKPGIAGKILGWSLEVCTRETGTLAVNESAFLSKNIKVYPNPTSGNFFIKSRDLGGDAKVSIYDINGRVVYSSGFNVVTGESTNAFDVKLQKGVYVLKLTSPKENYTQKLIIK